MPYRGKAASTARSSTVRAIGLEASAGLTIVGISTVSDRSVIRPACCSAASVSVTVCDHGRFDVTVTSAPSSVRASPASATRTP